MRVTCSVVSGADQDHLLRFLESMAPQDPAVQGVELDVTAIVNDGDWGLASKIGALATEILVRDVPKGFAYNHNEVLCRSDAEFHVIANDDVQVPHGVVKGLIDTLSKPEYQDVAVVSPQLRNPDGSLQPSTYSLPTLPATALAMSGLRERLGNGVGMAMLSRLARRRPGASRMWAHDKSVRVETLRGAFIVVRMACVQAVGLMDEVSLVGGEEAEWHARMRSSGWSVLFASDLWVTHVGRVSTGARSDLEIEYLKGTLNYFAKHRGPYAYRVVRILVMARSRYIAWRYRRQTGTPIQTFGPHVSSIAHRPWIDTQHPRRGL